jgi:hypothetical protein
MTQQFNEDGLSFQYPDDWTLQREDNPSGWAVSVERPGMTFLVELDRDMPTVEQVAMTALEALKADYPTLEAKPAIESMAGEMAIGHDIEFFSLDVPVTCWTRCFYGLAGTVLVLCQVASLDESLDELALRAICASMRSEEEEA